MTNKHLRAAGATVVALVVTSALAACGGAEPGDRAGGSADGGEAVDGAASAWSLTGDNFGYVRDSFSAWNDEHPDQQISVEEYANDAYKEKVRTAVGSGEAPTLILNWTGGTLADYVEEGDVTDISEGTQELIDQVMPSVAQNGAVDGTQYAVPFNDVQPIVLFYNAELFGQVGVEVPTTWDELMTAVEAFNAEGITPFSLAGQSVWPELMWIQYLTDRIAGPEAFQAVVDGEPGAWSHPGITEALEKIQQLVDAGAFGDAFGSVSADGGADVALVHTGQAAMLLQGSWVYPSFKNDAPEWFESGALGYTTFPAIESGQGDPANIVGNPANFWSVSADASESEQEAALQYLNEWVYRDEQITAMLDAGSVPPIEGLQDRIAESDDAEYLSHVYSMVDEAPNFQLSWDQALPPEQAQELLTNLSRIFLQEISPQEFVDAMNATS